jgi:hypothetical protein
MSGPYPPNTLLRHMGPHNYKVRLSVQATIFPHDAEGVSLWFSGQRLLTDGTFANSVKAKFAEFFFPAIG